jgi:ribosomal protein S18 acetylase RimI-like enzyme
MPHQIEIKRAAPENAQLISDLSTITFFDTFKDTCTDQDIRGFIDECFNTRQIEKELNDPNDFYFILFFNDVAAGYVRMKEDKSDVDFINKHKSIELKRIYVLKEYQSQKIGAKLMVFALDFAKEKGYELIWLGVWEHNEKAKAFYKKFKFEDTGVTHLFPIGNTPQTDYWLYRFIDQHRPGGYISP